MDEVQILSPPSRPNQRPGSGGNADGHTTGTGAPAVVSGPRGSSNAVRNKRGRGRGGGPKCRVSNGIGSYQVVSPGRAGTRGRGRNARRRTGKGGRRGGQQGGNRKGSTGNRDRDSTTNNLQFDEDDDEFCEQALLNFELNTNEISKSFKELNSADSLPGFETNAGDMWLYPLNRPIRDYQFTIVQTALYHNTLVSLPTGLGKTFIAAVVMYNFQRWYPNSLIIFMAPTRPLVSQQLSACHEIAGIPPDKITELTGHILPKKRKELWKKKFVFFVTPQVMAQDLASGFCPAEKVRCIVVDEAHKAVGNHSYSQVIATLTQQNKCFRVLALSATPGNDIAAVQEVLQNLLISRVELRSETDPDILPYTQDIETEKMVVPLNDYLKSIKASLLETMMRYTGNLLKMKVLNGRDGYAFSSYQLLKTREAFQKNSASVAVYQRATIINDFYTAYTLARSVELVATYGLKVFYSYLQGVMLNQKANQLVPFELRKNTSVENILAEVKEKLSISGEKSTVDLDNSSVGHDANSILMNGNGGDSADYLASHPKMAVLKDTIETHFASIKHTNSRVMVFSQYRDSVQEITKMLTHLVPVARAKEFLGQATTGSGARGLKQKEQVEVVRRFREGEYNVLVATCVGEEGLDIGEVDLIICYDAITSATRLVQRMGRTGRRRAGKIIFLLTQGQEESRFNQSITQQNNISRTIIETSQIEAFLYKETPRMVPAGIQPICFKMNLLLTSEQHSEPASLPNTDMAMEDHEDKDLEVEYAFERPRKRLEPPNKEPARTKTKKKKAAAKDQHSAGYHDPLKVCGVDPVQPVPQSPKINSPHHSSTDEGGLSPKLRIFNSRRVPECSVLDDNDKEDLIVDELDNESFFQDDIDLLRNIFDVKTRATTDRQPCIFIPKIDKPLNWKAEYSNMDRKDIILNSYEIQCLKEKQSAVYMLGPAMTVCGCGLQGDDNADFSLFDPFEMSGDEDSGFLPKGETLSTPPRNTIVDGEDEPLSPEVFIPSQRRQKSCQRKLFPDPSENSKIHEGTPTPWFDTTEIKPLHGSFEDDSRFCFKNLECENDLSTAEVAHSNKPGLGSSSKSPESLPVQAQVPPPQSGNKKFKFKKKPLNVFNFDVNGGDDPSGTGASTCSVNIPYSETKETEALKSLAPPVNRMTDNCSMDPPVKLKESSNLNESFEDELLCLNVQNWENAFLIHDSPKNISNTKVGFQQESNFCPSIPFSCGSPIRPDVNIIYGTPSPKEEERNPQQKCGLIEGIDIIYGTPSPPSRSPSQEVADTENLELYFATPLKIAESIKEHDNTVIRARSKTPSSSTRVDCMSPIIGHFDRTKRPATPPWSLNKLGKVKSNITERPEASNPPFSNINPVISSRPTNVDPIQLTPPGRLILGSDDSTPDFSPNTNANSDGNISHAQVQLPNKPFLNPDDSTPDFSPNSKSTLPQSPKKKFRFKKPEVTKRIDFTEEALGDSKGDARAPTTNPPDTRQSKFKFSKKPFTFCPSQLLPKPIQQVNTTSASKGIGFIDKESENSMEVDTDTIKTSKTPIPERKKFKFSKKSSTPSHSYQVSKSHQSDSQSSLEDFILDKPYMKRPVSIPLGDSPDTSLTSSVKNHQVKTPRPSYQTSGSGWLTTDRNRKTHKPSANLTPRKVRRSNSAVVKKKAPVKNSKETYPTDFPTVIIEGSSSDSEDFEKNDYIGTEDLKANRKRKSKPRNEFLFDEATVSGPDSSGSATDTDSDLDQLDSSFVADESPSQIVTESQAVRYMQSVKSPLIIAPRRMNLRKSPSPVDVASQWDYENTEYQNDSFCVDEDEVDFVERGDFSQAMVEAYEALEEEIKNDNFERQPAPKTRRQKMKLALKGNQESGEAVKRKRKRIVTFSSDEG